MTATTDALAAALVAFTEAVRAACAQPRDAIRILSQTALYQEAQIASAAPVGAAMNAASTAAAALCRRTALASLARACATYQPASYDDAAAIRDSVAVLMDNEAELAADTGDLASYNALRALRAAVVADLTARGEQLPRIATFTFARPMSALRLAYRIYGDARRADDLMRRTDVSDPSFMPTSFEALVS